MTNATDPGALAARLDKFRGGRVIAFTIALAASFLSEHYGAPAMLFALLIGMAFNFATDLPRVRPGIDLASKTLLRMGVALLGLRLTFADILQLGMAPILGVMGLLLATLLCGIGVSRLFGRSLALGLLTGGSVAICGASAALAISAVLPRHLIKEEDVLFTVVGVTALSTIAMVAFPILFTALGLNDVEVGYLIGATIHDVAQVVGAGYSVSDEAGDIATFTKLLRVATLPVLLLAIAWGFRNQPSGKVHLPWFVLAFVLLMLLRNFIQLPEMVLIVVNETSRFFLLTAISALGVRTSLAQIFSSGPRGFLVICIETFLLLGMALLVTHDVFR